KSWTDVKAYDLKSLSLVLLVGRKNRADSSTTPGRSAVDVDVGEGDLSVEGNSSASVNANVKAEEQDGGEVELVLPVSADMRLDLQSINMYFTAISRACTEYEILLPRLDQHVSSADGALSGCGVVSHFVLAIVDGDGTIVYYRLKR
ncbi:hypothetical protein HK102_007325, partial [Quaeritorhiza haematococci]